MPDLCIIAWTICGLVAYGSILGMVTVWRVREVLILT